jgi:hypothetical protein
VGTLLDEAGFKTKGVRRLRPRRSSPEKPGRESEQLTLL